jgi:hypothetical protein
MHFGLLDWWSCWMGIISFIYWDRASMWCHAGHVLHNSYWVVEASYASLCITRCHCYFVKAIIRNAFWQSILHTSHCDTKTTSSNPIVDVTTREKVIPSGVCCKYLSRPSPSSPWQSAFESSIIVQTSIGPCHVNPRICL